MKKIRISANQYFIWSHDRGLNPRPHPYHGCALPTELSRRNRLNFSTNASIIPHAMLLTKNVTNNIPDADAAKCADEALNNVNNPATASPIIASII